MGFWVFYEIRYPIHIILFVFSWVFGFYMKMIYKTELILAKTARYTFARPFFIEIPETQSQNFFLCPDIYFSEYNCPEIGP